jgi:chromosome segregation ATPase
MKVMTVFALFAFMPALVHGSQEASPVSKVFQMLSDLESKIIKEGEGAQKAYDEFAEWCEDRSRNVGFEIKTGKAEIAELKATIEKETSTVAALTTKIEELSGSIATNEADLKAATKIRQEEAADFAVEEKDLTEVISMLERAIAILEREMQKGGASMMQLQNTKSVVDALSALVEASVISAADSKRLTALVQSSQETQDNDEDPGAPAAAVYKGHSDGIIGTLEDLLEKAEGQLDKARKAEETSSHNFEMLKQSLTDEIEFAGKDMDAAKKGKAAAEEATAVAEGDLSVSTKDLEEDEATVKTLHQDCMTGANDFQAETKSRGEELKALAEAKKVLKEAVGGAAAQTYSFIQVFSRSGLTTGTDLANFEAVRFIRDLARKENSVDLAQLASRISSAMRFASAQSQDPFAKVKGLITDMITRLEGDAKTDASHKAYCDKETGEATAKKVEKKALIEKLSTEIDSMSARSAKLKEEVAELQKELAELASSQAEMDKIRSEEKALYDKNHAEMKTGIEGVQKALSILKDYYASEGKSHEAAEGAGSGIIGMLEVVESDFTKGLAEMEVAESTAVRDYTKVTKMNEITTATKQQDVKYKTKEAAGLDKDVAQTNSDLESAQAELDAVLEYLGKLGDMCTAKAEPYAERKARRDAEIDGLKQALSILEGEAVLIQQTSKRTLRGRQ